MDYGIQTVPLKTLVILYAVFERVPSLTTPEQETKTVIGLEIDKRKGKL